MLTTEYSHVYFLSQFLYRFDNCPINKRNPTERFKGKEMLWEYSEYVYTIRASSRYTETTGTGWRKGRKGKGLQNTESDSLIRWSLFVWFVRGFVVNPESYFEQGDDLPGCLLYKKPYSRQGGRGVHTLRMPTSYRITRVWGAPIHC